MLLIRGQLSLHKQFFILDKITVAPGYETSTHDQTNIYLTIKLEQENHTDRRVSLD